MVSTDLDFPSVSVPGDTFHPKTGEPVHVPERKAIRRASKQLKELINQPPPKKKARRPKAADG